MKNKEFSTQKKIIDRINELIATPSISSLDLSWDEGNRDVINILYSIGNKCYLTIDQFLYALKFYASA